jgi:hypothetical protein
MRYRATALAASFLTAVLAADVLPAGSAAAGPDCSNPEQPVKAALARAIETAVRTCGCSINVSHTLCSGHGDSPAHSEARALDINLVDGEPVGPGNKAARRLQEILQGMSAIEENFGPFVRERRRPDGKMEPVEATSDAFQSLIHVSVLRAP